MLGRPLRFVSMAIVGALSAALAAVAFFSLSPAKAQVASEIVVLQNVPVLATNGNANLPEFTGSGDGVLGVSCDGASPLGGSVVPAIVITRLDADLTRMRIASWGTGTPAVNGTVSVTCTMDVATGTTASSGLQTLQANLSR
jgi:hypothetical protein